jgi:hypothetical protein
MAVLTWSQDITMGTAQAAHPMCCVLTSNVTTTNIEGLGASSLLLVGSLLLLCGTGSLSLQCHLPNSSCSAINRGTPGQSCAQPQLKHPLLTPLSCILCCMQRPAQHQQ